MKPKGSEYGNYRRFGEKYQGEELLIKVTETDKLDRSIKGELILNSKNKNKGLGCH